MAKTNPNAKFNLGDVVVATNILGVEMVGKISAVCFSSGSTVSYKVEGYEISYAEAQVKLAREDEAALSFQVRPINREKVERIGGIRI